MSPALFEVLVYGIAFPRDAKNAQGESIEKLQRHPFLPTEHCMIVWDHSAHRSRYLLAIADTVKAEITHAQMEEREGHDVSDVPEWNERLKETCKLLHLAFSEAGWQEYSFTRG